MKRAIFVMILVTTVIWGISAQVGFFPSKQGVTLLYANLNAKGKVEMYTRQNVTRVEGSGDNMTITYLSMILDTKKIPQTVTPISSTITVTNGVAELDMKSLAAPATLSYVTIEGDRIRIPSTLSPGDKLADAHYIMTINMVVRIRTEISITGHECLAIEDVTVPAGTFKCHKLTQTSTATAMRKTVTTKTLTWYTPGIGMVKSETYNDKDKLQNSSVLQSITNE